MSTKRKILTNGVCGFVPLTRGLVAVIDLSDVEKISGVNWFAMTSKAGVYAASHVAGTRSKQISLHRYILDAPDHLDVDHKNGDTLDNRRSNIRLATTSQNLMNQKMSAKNSSGHTGVYWDKSRSLWAANIKIEGRHKTLGRFEKIEAAIIARKAAEAKFFGEFARAS